MRDAQEFVTMTLRNEAERCEDLEDIRALLKARSGWYLDWQRYMNQLVDESGLSYYKLAERCHVSKNSLKRWCMEGCAPKSRDTYLKLGFGFGMNDREINELLMRYGGYQGLYPKDLFDAVCLFLLARGGRTWTDVEALYQSCREIRMPQDGEEWQTSALREKLSLLQSEEDFSAFVQEHTECFSVPYRKLREYLHECMRGGQLEDEAESVHGICLERGIPERYESVLTELAAGRMPKRERLIALALYLDMTMEEMEQMLSLANMEPLCARNRLECVLIYALQQMTLLHPDLPLSNAMQLLSVAKNAAVREQCREIVKEYTETHYRCAEEELDSVHSYIRGILEQLDLDEAEELLTMI